MIEEIIKNYGLEVGVIAFFILTFVQITPIKINPWSWLAEKFGNAINKDMKEEQNKINGKLDKFIAETKLDNQALQRDRLMQIYHLTLSKGYILEKDSRNYHQLLERYVANGGNSYILHDVTPRVESFHVYNSDIEAKEFFTLHNEY